MAYSDPEAARVHARQYRKDNATEIRRRDRIRKRKKRQGPSSGEADMGRYVYQTKEGLRDSLRARVARLIAGSVPLSTAALKKAGLRGNNVRIRRFFAEMIESGEIRKDQLDEKRVRRNCGPQKIPRERARPTVPPPLANHAPEVPPEARKPRTLWQELAAMHWNPRRRSMFRRNA